MQQHQAGMVDASHFAMIPRADLPRSKFTVQETYKSTFDVGQLIPFYVQEILPGDVFNVTMTGFARLATLIFPMMDALDLCTFWFFVPNRLVWDHWENFMGDARPNPSSSINYLVPHIALNGSTDNASGTIYDYLGVPVPTSLGSGNAAFNINALPLRAYNLIYNDWFRDENLVNGAGVPTDDGPDTASGYGILNRAKRHDYFTSSLPFAQKGTAASIPLTGNAPLIGIGINSLVPTAGPFQSYETGKPVQNYAYGMTVNSTLTDVHVVDPTGNGLAFATDSGGYPQFYADLSQATAVTINALRQSFQIQKLLERDARGGTRYTEILRAHFGVTSPDARLQRPEYLGGGCTPVIVNPVAQTSVTAATPQGNLAGVGTVLARHGYSKNFVEHGFVIGILNIRANITYQQGLNKMWSRSTRYDYYWPEFAHLGEQAILNQEIYMTGGGSANDTAVFGYQERYAEYRYRPSQITGKFRSGITGTLDAWHLSESYSALPTLGATWISSKAPVVRAVAAGSLANGQQFLFDSVINTTMTRIMPMYGVPGMVDRF